jgi:hypothetical protein
LSQKGFEIKDGSKKVVIPIKLLNNLVFIKLKVNKKELVFLLDSGAKETVLFGLLQDKKQIELKKIEKVKLRGLGSEESIDGLKSTGNVLEIKDLKSTNHLMYVILDQNFNLSSHIGMPVNGIIGYALLKNNLVEISYSKKKLYIYPNNKRNRKRLNRKFERIVISVEEFRPYLTTKLTTVSQELSAKLLIDSGNSDALWLFKEENDKIVIPKESFDDYLGKGLSGTVIGKRGNIKELNIADFKFNNLIGAFPDSSSIKYLNKVPDRVGSVGSEILKRFTVIFDYPNSFLYLRKNKQFDAPFSFNRSGIEIKHSGIERSTVVSVSETIPIIVDTFDRIKEDKKANLEYKFVITPIYIIENIRGSSAAAKSGLSKGDRMISINSQGLRRFTLEEINLLLKKEHGNWVTIVVDRNGKLLKFWFQLVDDF